MSPQRRGTTIAELVIARGLLGVLAAIAVPRVVTHVDRVGVKGATQDVVLTLSAARAAASRRGAYASFVADTREPAACAPSAGVKRWSTATYCAPAAFGSRRRANRSPSLPADLAGAPQTRPSS